MTSFHFVVYRKELAIFIFDENMMLPTTPWEQKLIDPYYVCTYSVI